MNEYQFVWLNLEKHNLKQKVVKYLKLRGVIRGWCFKKKSDCKTSICTIIFEVTIHLLFLPAYNLRI